MGEISLSGSHLLAVHGDAKVAAAAGQRRVVRVDRRQRVNHNVHIVEVARNRRRQIVAARVRPHNVHVVVAHLPLLVHLLRVAGHRRHARRHVKDHLDRRRGEIRRVPPGRAVRVQAAQKARMLRHIDRPAERIDERLVLGRAALVAQNHALIVLPGGHIDDANLVALAAGRRVEQLEAVCGCG